jgi:hypothetical protein
MRGGEARTGGAARRPWADGGALQAVEASGQRPRLPFQVLYALILDEAHRYSLLTVG